jgi:hypothetical protein
VSRDPDEEYLGEVEPDDPDEWRDYCDDPYGDELDESCS